MARSRWDDPWQKFAGSKPIEVKDGLAVSRPRGAIASSWWSKRFVTTLESYGLGGRLERGRRYARQGQIVSMDVSSGLLAAQVQGSRPTPYVVTVAFPVPTDKQWTTIDQALRTRLGLAAALLAGEVPAELEAVFADAKVPLFPDSWKGLAARCSCPDHGDPCKHIAAVLYLFADRLDSDPWLLLTWRGRGQAEVLAPLGLAAEVAESDGLPPWWPLRPGEPLAGLASGAPAIEPPDPPNAVLRRLDSLDVFVGEAGVLELLGAAYETATRPSVVPD